MHVINRDSLHFRHAANDLAGNMGVNVALAVVLVLSAFLMATGSMVMERLVGSVNQLFEEAQPPHFLQMHKGEHDPDALERFAAEHPEIDAWLIEEMLGFDSAAIAWHRPSTGESGDLAESLIDNLFVSQNEAFDFLLDETGAIPRPSRGQVYVPVTYQQGHDLQVGDELTIRTDAGLHDLRVQGFVRDAQMASSLSPATRFLVSEADFRKLERAGGGAPEIITEYRLSDLSLLSQFQAAYESDQALPNNGPTVNFSQARQIHAISDGLAAVAMVFVGLLLIAIAILNLRFVIRGTLQDEVREIGVMKAIGLPDRAITALYLAKYRVLTLLACILGGCLAVIATNRLTQGVQVNYAVASWGVMTVLVPVLALLFVYLVVIALCRRALKAVRKVEVVNALVHGSTLDERHTARRAQRQASRVRRTSLAASRGRGINARLALLDLRVERGQWVLIPLVFFLASILITVPMNLLSTFESPHFFTFVGVPDGDLLADVQFSDDVDAVRRDVLSSMQEDDRLTEVRIFANELHEVQGQEGWMTLRVAVGDHANGTIQFLQGGPPGPGQIALSTLNAQDHEVSVSDELTIRRRGETSTVVVSGVYQDITNGGHTAKMHGAATTGAASYGIHANTVDGTDPATVATEYNERFPAATVLPMDDYGQQLLANVTSALRKAAILALVLGIGVAGLIATLFLKLRLTRERARMGALSAIGFSIGEISAQVRLKALLAVAVGTALGLVFAATAGESVAGFLVSILTPGLVELAFVPIPWLVHLAYPLTLTATGYLGAVVLTARLRGADKSSWLRA